MGIISKLIGGGAQSIAGAVTGVAEVFTENSEEAGKRAAERFSVVQATYSKETRGAGWWNQFVDGLNRLPRPLLAIGTIGLFVYCFADPLGFGVRMKALELVPQELWWLLGAIVSFYFGARELHKSRISRPVREVIRDIREIRKLRDHLTPLEAADDNASPPEVGNNPAIADFIKGTK